MPGKIDYAPIEGQRYPDQRPEVHITGGRGVDSYDGLHTTQPLTLGALCPLPLRGGTKTAHSATFYHQGRPLSG